MNNNGEVLGLETKTVSGYKMNGPMFNIYHVSPAQTQNPDEFDIFNGWKPVILKATGLVIRVVVFLLSAVIMFFCRKLSLT